VTQRTLLDLPRTRNCARGVSMTQTAIERAGIDELTAVSFSVVLVAVKTFASTLQPIQRTRVVFVNRELHELPV